MFVDDRLIARAIGTDGQDYHDDDAEEFILSKQFPILNIFLLDLFGMYPDRSMQSDLLSLVYATLSLSLSVYVCV